MLSAAFHKDISEVQRIWSRGFDERAAGERARVRRAGGHGGPHLQLSRYRLNSLNVMIFEPEGATVGAALRGRPSVEYKPLINIGTPYTDKNTIS